MKLLRLQLAYLYSGFPGGTVESRDAPKPWRVHHNHSKRNTVSAQREQEMAEFEFEQYKNDDDGVLLLNWWAFSKRPFFKKLPDYCRNCWYTNDHEMEKVANGIIIDNTRHIQHR